ncbi:thymidylate kinase [Candidatus Phytoplasma solani]|uniref:dTMP kinase n=1 Tax=Candidatus Phytoplasma solani TaxID=69896 RepID=UPI0032DB7109
MTNKLIVFEGLDGSGKTTLIKQLKKYFKNQNKKVILCQGLGSSLIGKPIRNLFLNQSNLSPNTRFLLSLTNMLQTQEELIIPGLSKNYIVLVDRWYDSTFAYQSDDMNLDYGDEITTSKIINHFLIKPNLTIYLDITPKIGLQRKQNQPNHKLDPIEQKPLNYFTNVRKNYLNQHKYCNNPNCKHENCNSFLINATQSKNKILKQIIKILTIKKIF